MTCNCDSGRLMEITAKCDDRAFMSIPHLDFEHDGYLPHIGTSKGIGGDYLRLSICIDCGKIQDWQSKTDEELTGTLVDEGLIEAPEESFDDEFV